MNLGGLGRDKYLYDQINDIWDTIADKNGLIPAERVKEIISRDYIETIIVDKLIELGVINYQDMIDDGYNPYTHYTPHPQDPNEINPNHQQGDLQTMLDREGGDVTETVDDRPFDSDVSHYSTVDVATDEDNYVLTDKDGNIIMLN